MTVDAVMRHCPLRKSIQRFSILLALVVAATTHASQSAALRRTFSAGAPSRYRVHLETSVELQGKRPLQIGSKYYVEAVEQRVHYRVSWRASRRVVQLMSDGSAEIEESLDEFSGIAGEAGESEEERQLAAALYDALVKWAQLRTLLYRESSAGQLTGLRGDAAPLLGENAPPVLTLWLLRALRPTVPLPEHPVRFGVRWQEPRSAQLENWRDVRGVENGEWLPAAPGPDPAARLHIVQQIFGEVAGGADVPDKAKAQASFHAESLTVVSLADGRALSAERSASREIQRVLESVPGLSEPQRFRARLAVQVRIEDCGHEPCLALDTPSVQRPGK
jgi:hypothetical protein